MALACMSKIVLVAMRNEEGGFFAQQHLSLACMFAQTRGGGNCANALTAAARLGLDTRLVSKVGDDNIGDAIEQELLADGVKTDFLLRAKSHPSPFTYIIVDRAGQMSQTVSLSSVAPVFCSHEIHKV